MTIEHEDDVMGEIPYKDFGLTKKEYWECRQNMHTPSFHTEIVFSEEEWGEDWCNVLYFDSDDGIALFSSDNEMFEETGFSMKLIECQYCDIPFSYMIEIIEIFKGFEEVYKEREEERNDRTKTKQSR